MSDFKVYTKETAPEASTPVLETIKGKYGFVPNLFGVLAETTNKASREKGSDRHRVLRHRVPPSLIWIKPPTSSFY